MQQKYIIRDKISQKECSLEILLSKIYYDFEIFELSKDPDEEKYIATISKEAMLHILSQLYINACEHYFSQGKTIHIWMKECISFLKKWVDDKSSLPDIEYLFTMINQFERTDTSGNIGKGISYLINCILYQCFDKNQLTENISYCHDEGDFSDSLTKCLTILVIFERLEYRFSDISGQFIIDFLKSGKHLFMV